MLNNLTIIYLLLAANLIFTVLFLMVYCLKRWIISISAITYSKILKIVGLFFIFPIIIILFFLYKDNLYSQIIYLDHSPDFEYMKIMSEDYLYEITNSTWLTLVVILQTLLALGIAVKLILYLRNVYRTKKVVMAKNRDEEKLNSILRKCLNEEKINRKIEIYKNGNVFKPCLIQLKYPTILIPELNYSDKDLAYFIKHELYHISAHDLFYLRLAKLYKIIYWYNPIVYLFSKSLVFSFELANDERLTSVLDRQEKLYFVNLLGNCYKQMIQCQNLEIIAFSDVSKKYSNITRRIEFIMNFKTGFYKSVVSILVSVLFLIASPMTAYALSEQLYDALPTDKEVLNSREMIVEEQTPLGEGFEEYIIENPFLHDDSTVVMDMGVIPYGGNNVDITISENGQSMILSTSLSASSNVDIYLVSNSGASFSFTACPINGGTCRAVYSNANHIISYSMSNFENAMYKLYVTNTSSQRNNIVGTINIY